MDKYNFEKVPTGIFDKVRNNKQQFVEKFIDDLEELFPETVKDGKVDFDALLERFGEYQNREEKYELTWVGKNKAVSESYEDIVGRTLKYVEEESRNPETTENLYIEGDNLEVLKLLRNSYYGKIKMIYIDPPYNTGSDFIYKDDFTLSKEEYDKLKGNVNEYGERLVKNSADSGRYHSNWLNMMYPRLQVAKDLLTDDGVIFISTDDNEMHNLRKICDEVYGDKNFLSTIAIKMSESSGNKMAHVEKRLPKLKEYVVVYKRSEIRLNPVKVNKPRWDDEYRMCFRNFKKEDKRLFDYLFGKNEITEEDIKCIDKILSKVECTTVTEIINSLGLQDEDSILKWKHENAFRIFRTASSTSVRKLADTKRIINKNKYFSVLSSRDKILYIVKSDYDDSSRAPRVQVIFAEDNLRVSIGDFWGDISTTGLEFEGGVDFKNGKKPLKLMDRLLKLCTNKGDIILDFFSGSATTAHAIIDLNAEDGGNRKFIMVQLPEPTDEKSEAYKSGYKTISEIGKERIRRAGDKILEDNKDKEGVENLDIGFRVFKVENTNFKRVKDIVAEGLTIEQHKAISLKDKEDFNPHFTDLDVVYELILKRQDIKLTEEIKKMDEIGDRTYIVGGTMLVCLEDKVTEGMVEQTGNLDTDLSWIVLRDSAFDDNCELKINTVNKLRTFIRENREKEQRIYWI